MKFTAHTVSCWCHSIWWLLKVLGINWIRLIIVFIKNPPWNIHGSQIFYIFSPLTLQVDFHSCEGIFGLLHPALCGCWPENVIKYVCRIVSNFDIEKRKVILNHHKRITYQIQYEMICGLVVRWTGFHPDDPGSIPRWGNIFYFS